MTTKPVAEADVVDLDTYKPKKQPKRKRWVEGLTNTDKAVLCNGDWLNDDIVNACQQLLSRQFSSLRGLQSVNLGRTLAFNIERGEFVQILHTGQGHWVTISTIGCTTGEVNVFDSLPPAPTTDLLNQIAAILCTPKDTIKVKYIDVQMQEGYSNCGVFGKWKTTRELLFQARDNEGSRDEMSAGAKRHHVPSKEDEACCTESKECH